MGKRKFNDDDNSDDDLQLINAANEYENKFTKKIRKSTIIIFYKFIHNKIIHKKIIVYC